MTSTWSDLASSPRWDGVVSFIRNWVGPFNCDQGMAPAELDVILRAKSLDLPLAVREWYLLAANWNQGRLNVWIHPRALTACDGMISILTDTEGWHHWGVRVADLEVEDPPVVSLEGGANEIKFPSFSKLVAAMTVNDVIFDYETEAPVELHHDAVPANLTCLVTTSCGDYFADAPLRSATVVMFAYPGNGQVFGKSRTAEGRLLLQRLCRKTK